MMGAAWFVATAAVLVYGFRLAMFVSPPDAEQGNVGRIIYWHVPHAMLSLIFPYINFAASVAYLALRRSKPAMALLADAWALASAEVTVVYATIVLGTGMLWGKAAWGIWWAWDARLTTYLLLWLLYVAYLMIRRLSAAGQVPTVAAVLSVFAAIDVPITFMSIRWWRTQHPAPVFGGAPGSGMDKSMLPAFYWCVLGWFMWGVFILGLRFALERRRQILERSAVQSALEVALGSERYSSNLPEGNRAF